MSDNVISLRGGGVSRSDTSEELRVNETAVAELERLLALAKAGEIIGVAGAYTHQNDLVSYSYAGAVGGFAMIGGLDCVRERLLRSAVYGEV